MKNLLISVLKKTGILVEEVIDGKSRGKKKKKISTIDFELNDDYELNFLSQDLFLYLERTLPKEFLISFENYYSLDSLNFIEKYLDTIGGSKELEEYYNIIVLKVGAHVGEVIKKNSKKDYHWYYYEKASEFLPSIKHWEEQIETIAVLYSMETGETIFPIGNVCKYLDNGKEDSLFFYAQAIIS